jgi:hypothetical protein
VNERNRRWLVELGCRIGRYALDSLALMGSYLYSSHHFASWPGSPPTTEVEDGSDPPPGHPECLVPGVPPSEVESALWAQLVQD